MGFKNGSKKAKKRELGENGENSGENKTPFPTYFSGTLKILLERTFTPFEVRLINAMSRERVLKTYVNEVKKNYDYVLIDCMPSLGMITINALAAADSVIIPTQPHYLSAKGLELFRLSYY